MDGEQEYWSWVERLDEYLFEKLEILEYDYRLKPRQREIVMAYTNWAVTELCDRFIDICPSTSKTGDPAFEILEDFMWEMLIYRKIYGYDKDNKKVTTMFDIAVEVAEEIGLMYFRSRHE